MILYNCKELATRSTRGEFDEGGLFTRLLIRMHMAMCAHCRRYAAQLRLIAEAARARAKVDPAALKDLKARLIERLGR